MRTAVFLLLPLLACTSGLAADTPAASDAPAIADAVAIGDAVAEAVPSPAAPSPPAAPPTLHAAATAAGLSWPPPDVHITIDKSDRQVVVWSGATALGTYSAAFGGTLDDKVQRGDSATPEGAFTVVTRNPQSNFHLFLGISYPDGADADRGEAAGLITAAQARAIREADAADRQPPWNTRLGGAVGLHGGGSGADWTLGCIAVDNDIIEQIWEIAPHGTPVVITR